MALPELLKARVEQQLSAYCERRVPLQVRDRVRWCYVIKGAAVTLYEERVMPDHPDVWARVPMAQLRFEPDTLEWTLYHGDRNTSWRRYRYAERARNIGALLHVIDTDTQGVFYA